MTSPAPATKQAFPAWQKERDEQLRASRLEELAGTDAKQLRAEIIRVASTQRNKIRKLAPRGMDPEYYIASLDSYIWQNPALLLVRPASIVKGLLQVAESNLRLGASCDLLRFGDVCRFNARYNGLVELACAAGTRAINFGLVRDDDIEFRNIKGSEPQLIHEAGPGKGLITHAYAIGEIKPRSFAWEVITRDEIDEVRERFSDQWWERYDDLTGKTVRIELEEIPWYPKKRAIRVLSPLLPKNIRFEAALRYDEQPVLELEDGGLAEEPVAPADGRIVDSQKKRLLQLVDSPLVPPHAKTTVRESLDKGAVDWATATNWIGILEPVAGL